MLKATKERRIPNKGLFKIDITAGHHPLQIVVPRNQ